jgi:hypothetical protein
MGAHPLLYTYLWITPHALLVVLAVIMVRRGLVKEFPAFFLYAVYQAVDFVVLYVLYRLKSVSGMQFAQAWLAGAVISSGLRFAIIQEIFRHVFGNYPALKDFGTLLFRWATAVLMIVAVTLVAFSSGSEMDRLTLTCTVVDRAVSTVQCGLLVLILLLTRFLSLPWRSYVFGIALGLGFFASTELGIAAIRVRWGLAVRRDLFALLTMAVYHCCVLFWIVTLLLPQPAETRVTSVPTHDLDHWNDALERLLQQ